MSYKEELVAVCHKAYKNGFVSAYDGNISCRISDNRFLITRSGICKGDVTADDIIEINSDGDILEGKGKISTEHKIHLFAYSNRKEVNAVVHCHPIYSTAFSVLGEGLTKNILPEVILTIGKVPLCSYATPSTDELPQSMKPYIDHAWAFILQNHGAVTLGKTLFDAYYKMEKLEHTARVVFISRLMGGTNELSDQNIKKLFSIAESTYGIRQDKRNVF